MCLVGDLVFLARVLLLPVFMLIVLVFIATILIVVWDISILIPARVLIANIRYACQTHTAIRHLVSVTRDSIRV